MKENPEIKKKNQVRERNSKLHNFDITKGKMGKIDIFKIVLMMMRCVWNECRAIEIVKGKEGRKERKGISKTVKEKLKQKNQIGQFNGNIRDAGVLSPGICKQVSCQHKREAEDLKINMTVLSMQKDIIELKKVKMKTI